ncbi:hypothetical protein NEP61_17310, partial [Escherichia coli]|nr:hypothetical protein [Escherichia coli]MDI1106267.1 hypothetical protein [Escherichia coli]
GHPCPHRRRIDLSKPTLIENQCCKNGGDHRFCASKKPAARSVAGFVFQVIEVNGKNAIIMRYRFINCNDVDSHFSLCNHNHCFVQEI